jgi:thymidylate synthase
MTDNGQELIDLMAVVTDEPEDFYFPESNYLPCDRAFIQQYISQILDDAPQQEGVKYTYGQRLRSHFGLDRVEQAIGKLAADFDSARAVMSLWDVRDGEANNSPPCLNHVWARIVDNELSLTATFRSNDMFSAWVANAMGLRALQQHIRNEIEILSKRELKLGALITISQSAHIYDDCWENVELLIQSQYSKICANRDDADPAGSFVINVQDDQILVEHMTPGSGAIVNCYSGRSAVQIYRQIAAECPSLQVEHAMYLGTELQKAEMALSMKNGDLYQQDRTLKVN